MTTEGRRTVSVRQAIAQGIKQSDLRSIEKLRIRMALAFSSDARLAVEQFVVDVAAEEAELAVSEGIDIDQLEKIIQLIIKYLPQIFEILIPLFS